MRTKEIYATKLTCSKCCSEEYFDHRLSGRPDKAYALKKARDKGWVNKSKEGWTCHQCMLDERIYYTDFETGEGKFTTGKFTGWARETDGKGHHLGWHATVMLPKSMLSIPAYCLTDESRNRLPTPSDTLILAMILELLGEHGEMALKAIESQIPGSRGPGTTKCWDVIISLMQEGRIERVEGDYFRDMLRLVKEDVQ